MCAKKTPGKRKGKAKARAKTRPNALWGGRFSAGPAAIMEKINASIDFDRKLAVQDITASVAHCEMLTRRG
ncbi:MAG: argininosuccinate lyase, partial [Alphaproteobacteria bacterium]|nr:argininosuccinate lyase [Alphaproteobacteria bacterium]